MTAWLVVTFLSLATGIAIASIWQNGWSVFASFAIPWLGFLAYLLYLEYFVPYQGGGASMWPIAQLVGGTYAAICGGVGFGVLKALKSLFSNKDT